MMISTTERVRWLAPTVPRIQRRGLAQAALALLMAGSIDVAASQQPAPAAPSPQQRAAMLQQWMKASQAQLRTYEWVETTVVAKDGQEKSRKQNRCYYGADGKLQKTPIVDPAASQ